MHHVHISTGALFLMGLFVFGIIAACIYAVNWRRQYRDNLRLEELKIKSGYKEPAAQTASQGSYSPGTGTQSGRFSASRPQASNAPRNSYAPQQSPSSPAAQPSPVVVNNGSSSDGLLTGMMLGEMMSGNCNNTVIEREVVETPSRENFYSPDTSNNDDDDNNRNSGIDFGNSSSGSDDSSSGIDISTDNSGSGSDIDIGGGGDSGGGIDFSF